MMLSESPSAMTRSSLEEMLDSLRQQDEAPEKPKDLPPALPARPTSRARLPSAHRSLPMDFKVDANGQVARKMENGIHHVNEDVKRKEKELAYGIGSFGSKKAKKDQKSVDSNPYVEEKDNQVKKDSVILPRAEELDCDHNIGYFIQKKLLVWCQLANGRWVSGTIQSTSGDDAFVSLSSESVTKVSTRELLPANPDILLGVDDLIQLIYLNEPSVLHNLKCRYSQDIIYSKAGLVLIAVNPFKDVSIYGEEIVTACKQKDMQSPHVYAIADTSYNDMTRDGKNQSIIISGESGAGKTEAAKHVMHYLTTVAGGPGGIDTAILFTNFILEAFGNAKTSRNANSSRFGKLIEIHFTTLGKICGASIQTFLLEKSRVVQLAKNERSYHIFYQLCAGAPSTLKERLKIKKASEYHYLNQSDCLIIGGVDDAMKFHKLMEALDIVQICEHDQQQMFSMLAAVLWLGNISFEGVDNENHVEVLADQAVTNTAELMNCIADDLIIALSTYKIQAGKDSITKRLTLQQAIDRRDALAKFIYASLFDWLVEQINKSLDVGKLCTGKSISILDIYGFESFETNSFEQFCINYANERLQQHFNRHLFKLEQEEYEEDGIDWTKVDFQDNQECLNLFEKKPLGLLSLLDEECYFPNGSDLSFANKLKQHLSINSSFKGQRGRAFGVCHYAGEVIYDTNGFLEKNRDPLHPDFIQLLSTCSCQLLQLFASKMSNQHTKPASSLRQLSGLASTMQSVGTKFKGQLFKLMNQLETTRPHFIRCIKPNAKLLPGIFDDDLVLQQLRCCGVLEVVRISKSGYPTRMTHQEFAERYGFLLLEKNSSMDPLSISVTVLQRFNVAPELYQVGLSKVYLRTGQIGKLEERRKLLLRGIVWIQSCFRCYKPRRFYQELRKGTITLQSFVRGEIARKNYDLSKKKCTSSAFLEADNRIMKIIYLQSVIRGRLPRRHFRVKLKLKHITPGNSPSNTPGNTPRRRPVQKLSEVKVIPQEQADFQTSIIVELEKRVAKAEVAISLKEEENSQLKEQLQQFERRWSEYEVKMKMIEETWQMQMESLQMSLAAARNSLAADNTAVQPGKHEGVTSPHSYDSEDNDSVGSITPVAGGTPRTFATAMLDGRARREYFGPKIAVRNLTNEFEQKKEAFDADVQAFTEERTMHQSSSRLSPEEELRQLKHRFQTWKRDYKLRLRETKLRLHRLGTCEGSRRKWWGRLSTKGL